MDQLGNHSFPGARFADDEDWSLRGGELFDLRPDLFDLLALADDERFQLGRGDTFVVVRWCNGSGCLGLFCASDAEFLESTPRLRAEMSSSTLNGFWRKSKAPSFSASSA
jgi:hypothetical protein